jgi:hypothetical protein
MTIKLSVIVEEKPVALKTIVNTRASLDTRCAPIQSRHTNSKTIGAGLGASMAALVSSSSGADGAFKTAVRLMPKRQCDETSYTAAMTSTIRSASDVPPRGKEVTATSSVTAGAFDAASTMHSATSAQLRNGLQEHFYSDVRQIERRDDDCRTLGKGSQRTVDIMLKRETDPTMQPPPQEFLRTVRRTPADVLPPVSVAQMVQCTHLGKPSTHQIDFQAPAVRLPGSLDTTFTTQSKIVSGTGSAHDLFYGTPKARGEVIPGYMGHCPAAPCNISAIKGETNEIQRPHAKCSVNLASSSGSNTGKEARERSPECRASTMAGFYLEQAVGATKKELSLNRREHRVR